MTESKWSSKVGFILASAGSAIGLGAMWKFPYVMADSGGAAFLVLFILFTILIGLPLLLSEFVIGRHSGTYSIEAFGKLSGNKAYNSIGHLGNIGVFLLLSFYSVIGGWIILYILRTIKVLFTGETTNNYEELFGSLISSPTSALLGTAGFIIVTGIIVAGGIQNGIERASKVLMPLLFISFVIIIIRSLTLPGSFVGVEYFLKPDFSSLNADSVLFALGQSFFSLSVGFGGMLTYASYLDKKTDLMQSGISVVALNIIVTLCAGLAIFPATASLNIDNAQGPGLLFIVLPYVFNHLPLGTLFYLIFLFLFFFATVTSSISLLEINVANIIKNDNNKRPIAVTVTSILLFIVGIPSALSNGLLDMKFLAGTFFDNVDYLVSNIMLPIGALAFAIFTGYILDRRISEEELVKHPYQRPLYKIWVILLKYVIPAVIIFVFITTLLK